MSYSGVGKEETERAINAIRGAAGVYVSYMPWLFGNHSIMLEGEFTLPQLEALVALMKEAQS